MIYHNIFLSVLQEDLMSQPKLKPYQRKGARGINRIKQNQVPEYARGRGDLNPKVEMLRRGKRTSVVLTPSDVSYVRNRYNIHDIGDGKMLGSTGIKIMPGGNGRYILVK